MRTAKRGGASLRQTSSENAGRSPQQAGLAAGASTGVAAPVCSGTGTLHDGSCGTSAPCTTCNTRPALCEGRTAEDALTVGMVLPEQAREDSLLELQNGTDDIAWLEEMASGAEADDEAGITLHPPQPDTLWQYHVVYSASYGVPLLLFRVSDTGAALSTLSQYLFHPIHIGKSMMTFRENSLRMY